jgi:hypothetical protein
MADHDFELRLQRVLLADAERAVRPFDPVVLATAAAATPAARRPLEWRPAGWPVIRLVLIAMLLILAAVATLWLASVGAPARPSLVEVMPSATTTASVAPSASAGPLTAELSDSSWIAPAPAGLQIAGGTVVDPFLLGFDSGGILAYLPIGTGREKLASSVASVAPDELRFVTRPGAGDKVTMGDEQLGACAAGDEGSYRVSRSADGLLMTLVAIADVCPSRAAVLARTWWRYLGRAGSGGIGVVDGFDPMFVVTLPPGSYEPDRTPGNLSLRQAAPAFEFLSWKDPQGFNDPCDPLGKGRRPIADATGFVEYFRQLPGFTVDSVTDLQIEGRPAINLKLHANPDASCPAGWLVQWQPAEGSGDVYWYLRPGDSDSLYLVDLESATLMFEVLAGPQDLEGQIVPTIRILEGGLPPSP